MIIQCAHCSSKFRLDDSKVTEAGIKVRCSKCKHVFIVKKEASAEEPDLDLILQGLHSPASERGTVAEPPASATGAAAPAVAFEGFGDDEVTAPGMQTAEAAPEAPPEPRRESKGEEVDEFSFGEAPFAPQEEVSGFHQKFISTEVDFGTAVPEEPAEEAVGAFPPDSVGIDAMTRDLEPPAEDFAVSSTEDIVFGEVSPEAFAAATQIPESSLRGETAESPEITFEFEEEPALDEVSHPPGGEKGAESFDFGEIDFGIEDGGTAESRQEAPSLGYPEIAEAPRPPKEPEAASELGPEPVPAVAVPFGEEELPPLTISSRRRGQSFLPAAVITVSVLVIIALAGVGFYFFKEGPEALDKLGVGFVADWLGMESREEGGVGLDKVRGAYLTNGEAGEVFAIRGEAVNNFRKPRASIQVRGALLGPNGQVLVQKVAYCGNNLSDEQISALPMARIDAAMNNQFGDSLANLGVAPGMRIPFVIVLAKVPREAVDFSVEVVGSTVASQ